jgi:glycosyltransferase involved in cell wall biosynthesis
VPAWFADLDAQLAAADFPARALPGGLREVLSLGRSYDGVIAPFAGGSMLPAAYAGAKRFGKPFVLWASVWHQPRSAVHALALPVTRHIYRHADSVIAYGPHVRRFAAGIRGHDDDIVVAPQAVEEIFSRVVSADEVAGARAQFDLDADAPIVLYVGRLDETKGVADLAAAWPLVSGSDAQLAVAGDGPLRAALEGVRGVRVLGPVPRVELPALYAAAALTVVPSIPTPRFKEPWGLVVNEAFAQGRPVIATTAVGAVAGGLLRSEETGVVVAPGDPAALAAAIDRLLADSALRSRLGDAARTEAAAYTYDAMAAGVARALSLAGLAPR